MRYRDSIFANLLKALPRWRFERIVARHGGDRYVKSLRTWTQLVAMVFAQLGSASSLRGLVASWNANAHHHYHLGVGAIRRSTLADANKQRPAAIFAEAFAELSNQAGRRLRREGRELVRLLDATPIPLGGLFKCAEWNGRTKGMKLHLVYDPDGDHPMRVDIAPANVNDVCLARNQPPEPGATYVFDKAYADYEWWTRLHEAGCTFVTRPKTNVRFTLVETRPLPAAIGEDFVVIEDSLVRHQTRSHLRLPMMLRRIVVRRLKSNKTLTLICNDPSRSANDIATLYKTRWRIELLFRWIKQHLKIRTFLGRSKTAVQIQILVAMIAFLLLRLAAEASQCPLPAIRFAELIGASLFIRRTIERIDKPPDQGTKIAHANPNQLGFPI